MKISQNQTNKNAKLEKKAKKNVKKTNKSSAMVKGTRLTSKHIHHNNNSSSLDVAKPRKKLSNKRTQTMEQGIHVDSEGDNVGHDEVNADEQEEGFHPSSQQQSMSVQTLSINPFPVSLSSSSNQHSSQASLQSSELVEKESQIINWLQNKFDDYSFLDNAQGIVHQLHLKMVRESVCNWLFSTSRMQWIMRKSLFIPNETRESSRNILYDTFRNCALQFDFANIQISPQNRIVYNDLINAYFTDGGAAITDIKRKLANYDKRIRKYTRIWMSILNINVKEFNNENSLLWYFNATRVKELSPLFIDITNESYNTIFPLFACLVAFSTTPEMCKIDRWKMYVIIHKLLNGSIVKLSDYLDCITKNFLAIVAGIVKLSSQHEHLKRGPGLASVESESVFGEATKIMNEWNSLPTLLPNEFRSINNGELKTKCINTINSQMGIKSKKKNGQTLHTNICYEESYPCLDNYII